MFDYMVESRQQHGSQGARSRHKPDGSQAREEKQRGNYNTLLQYSLTILSYNTLLQYSLTILSYNTYFTITQ